MTRAPLRQYPSILIGLMIPLVLSGCSTPGPTADRDESGAAPPAAEEAAGDPAGGLALPDPLPDPGPLPTPAGEDGGAAADDLEPVDVWARLRNGFRLDGVAHARVDSALELYAGRQRYFDRVARRAQPFLRYILERIEARDMPAELLLIPVVESAFRPFAYSHARAGGLWQFKPLTGQRFGLQQNWWYDGRRDVLASTDAALDYLAWLHGYFEGDWLLAIAAYNGGEGTVRRAIRANAARGEPTDYWHLDLPTQTEHYVPRILALREILAEPAAHGIELPRMPAGRALTVVEADEQIDLALAAEWAEMPLETLQRYNAGYNRWATPPQGPHRLAVPRQRAGVLRAALDGADARDMVRWQRHAVVAGDTLSGIATQYGTTVEAIRSANDLQGTAIRAGGHLLVPSASRDEADYSLTRDNRRRRRQAEGQEGRERIDYRVRRGDTLWAIARDHDVGVRRLAAWNDMAPGDPIRPGQRVVIWVGPGQGGRGGPADRLQEVTYTVRPGDSLAAIARRFNVSVEAIRQRNSLDRDAYLQPGQRLEVEVDVTEQAGSG